MRLAYPQRIICLTEETTETLYLLGEESRIVGISGYTERPARARKEKPTVSAFTNAKIDEIVALQPDLVLGFSDLQAEIARELIKRGLEVHVFNQRTIAGILSMIQMLGAMIGCEEKSRQLVRRLQTTLDNVRSESQMLSTRPRVYFEEWDSPMISGIQWISELIHLAGGEDCFHDLSHESLAQNRVIADPDEVVRRQPDIIVASWCGKKLVPEQVVSRPGWQDIPAIQNSQVHEIPSARILQPGPAALSDGVRDLLRIFKQWDAASKLA